MSSLLFFLLLALLGLFSIFSAVLSWNKQIKALDLALRVKRTRVKTPPPEAAAGQGGAQGTVEDRKAE